MARWRLIAKHYLNVEGTTYRREEQDRETGEQAVLELPVCRFLDPENPKDCRSQGDCVVFLKGSEGKPQKGDFVFTGGPTPDMEPLDAEAEAITETYRASWTNPIEDMPDGQPYADSIGRALENALTAAFAKGATIQPQSMGGVSAEATQTKTQRRV
jgi:hypothetical protein